MQLIELLSTENREYAKSFFQRHMREDVLRYGERQAINIALSALTINPKELRPKGEWVMKDDNGNGVCSQCNRQDKIDPLATHCRYCGADMRGEIVND